MITNAVPKTPLVGRILTGLVGLSMLGSASAKLAGAESMVENLTNSHLGGSIILIAVIELIVATLFLIPKTSSLGTLLVTGYFGGAVVAHLAANDVPGVVPALVIGAMAWGANYFRNRNMFESFSV